jgi:hypothetical protein
VVVLNGGFYQCGDGGNECTAAAAAAGGGLWRWYEINYGEWVGGGGMMVSGGWWSVDGRLSKWSLEWVGGRVGGSLAGWLSVCLFVVCDSLQISCSDVLS